MMTVGVVPRISSFIIVPHFLWDHGLHRLPVCRIIVRAPYAHYAVRSNTLIYSAFICDTIAGVIPFANYVLFGAFTISACSFASVFERGNPRLQSAEPRIEFKQLIVLVRLVANIGFRTSESDEFFALFKREASCSVESIDCQLNFTLYKSFV